MMAFKSEDEIRAILISGTPLGSDTSQVKNFFREENIQSIGFYESSGYPLLKPKIGAMLLKGLVGSYREIVFKVSVVGNWVFDSQGKLIEIKVEKEKDAF